MTYTTSDAPGGDPCSLLQWLAFEISYVHVNIRVFVASCHLYNEGCEGEVISYKTLAKK